MTQPHENSFQSLQNIYNAFAYEDQGWSEKRSARHRYAQYMAGAVFLNIFYEHFFI